MSVKNGQRSLSCVNVVRERKGERQEEGTGALK
jgi:hypothetical protein